MFPLRRIAMESLAEALSFVTSALAEDSSSNLASSSSTPPTTVTDSDSLHSDASKHDVITVVDASTVAPAPALPPADVPSPRRPRRARASLPVYNLSKLSGTSGHGKRRAKGDIVSNRRRRRTIAGTTLTPGDADVGAPDQGSAGASLDALTVHVSPSKKTTPRAQRQARPSPRSLRSAARDSGDASADGATADTVIVSSSITAKLFAAAGKRGRKAAGKIAGVRMSRELRRLQDTKEFKHIDDRPVVHSVWSNGKYVDPNQPTERQRARKKAKPDTSVIKVKEESEEPAPQSKKRRVKKYLNKGLYSGQDVPQDLTRGLTATEKKQLAQLPELMPRRENKVMPAPIFTGFRTLLAGRDFKLPFHVCNPLPPGQPKPDEWKKMTKSMTVPRLFVPLNVLTLLFRPIHWRIQGNLEKDAAYPRLSVQVCVQARGRLQRELPEQDHAV